MDTIKICPNCKKPLPPDVPMGLCPECLLKAGFPSEGGGTPAAGFVPPPVEEIARLFPQLEILGLLGKGGMGAVYKARQPSLDRLVALKVLPPTVATDPGFAERFNREARALARLSHPNIVAVHDFGQAGSLNYLLMELVDGSNLREMEQAGRLTPEQAMAIVPQICDALQFAHSEGIVHRDIKPENILIDKKGRLKITDFGIAKIIGAPEGKVSLTGVRDIMGTPHYMAPEQIERPLTVDHRADIYSLGVVFYEMLTGELPLGKFQAPSRKVQMDVRLDEVVLRTLEKEPERRYQQASEVKTRVETIVSTPGQAGIQPIVQPATPPTSDKTILPAFLLAFFFGPTGAHRLYVGKIRTGFLQLGLLLSWIPLIVLMAAEGDQFEPLLGLTFAGIVVACGVWWIIDWILIACKAFTDGNNRRITSWFNPGPGVSTIPPLPAPPGMGPVIVNKNIIVAPAVGLLVAGALKVFSGLKMLLFLGPASGPVDSILSGLGIPISTHLPAWVTLASVTMKVGPGILIVFGAVEMIQIRNYAWAVAAAIISIIACSIIGFPVGIWALIVLMRADIRATFASPPVSTGPKNDKWRLAAGVAAGAAVLLILISMLFSAFGQMAKAGPLDFLQRLGFSPDAGDSATEPDASADSVDTNSTGNIFPAGAAKSLLKVFPTGPNGTLTVKADRGEVQVTASDENSVKIKVTREVTRAGESEAAKILKDERLVVKLDGHDVSITTVDPFSLRHFSWWMHPNLEVHYEITVPRDYAAQIHTMGGGIRMTGLRGNVSAKTAGGELNLDSLGGAVDGETMGGGITVDKFAGPSLRAHTMGGSVSADFAVPPQSDCDLHTMGGNVTAKIPAAAALNIDARTMGGTATSDVPIQIEGRPHDNSLQGRINGGGPVLKLGTMGGNIEVLRHE